MAARTGSRKHAQQHLTYSLFVALVQSCGPWATVALSCTRLMAAGPGSGKAYLLADPALFLYRMIAATPWDCADPCEWNDRQTRLRTRGARYITPLSKTQA